jgi:hypothetical protein
LAGVLGQGDAVAHAMEGALEAVGLKGRAVSLAVDTLGASWNRRRQAPVDG